VQHDLDAHLAAIAARRRKPDERETNPNGVRKVVFRDPDDNELGFGARRSMPVGRPERHTSTGRGPNRALSCFPTLTRITARCLSDPLRADSERVHPCLTAASLPA